MKRQIIAKINNIANELDRSGLYAEASTLTRVMKKLAEYPEIPEVESVNIIVSYTEDEYNPYQSKYEVRVFIDERSVEDYNHFDDENGMHLLNDLNKANEIADQLKEKYEDQYPGKVKAHKLQLRRPNPRIPGDPYDDYKDRNPYRNEDRGFRGRRRY